MQNPRSAYNMKSINYFPAPDNLLPVAVIQIHIYQTFKNP